MPNQIPFLLHDAFAVRVVPSTFFVKEVTDQGANGFNATQDDPALMPTIGTVDGFPAVLTRDVKMVHIGEGVAIGRQWTAFVVAKVNALLGRVPDQCPFLSTGRFGNWMLNLEQFAMSARDSPIPSSVATDDNFDGIHLWAVRRDLEGHRFYRDGVFVGSQENRSLQPQTVVYPFAVPFFHFPPGVVANYMTIAFNESLPDADFDGWTMAVKGLFGIP